MRTLGWFFNQHLATLSTSPRPHAVSKDKSVWAAAFRQEDISQNLAEASSSPWLWEFDCYANNCC